MNQILTARPHQLHLVFSKFAERTEDGTLYAGTSPATGQEMYVAPCDELLIKGWGSGVDSQHAIHIAETKAAHGHQDWRLPTVTEFLQIYNRRHHNGLQGTFNATSAARAGGYWCRHDSTGDICRVSSGSVMKVSGGGQSAAVRLVRG